MKRIIVRESQLREALDQMIDKKPGETLDTAIKNAAQKVAQEAPNVDVNFVVPKDEVNEENNSEDDSANEFWDNIGKRDDASEENKAANMMWHLLSNKEDELGDERCLEPIAFCLRNFEITGKVLGALKQAFKATYNREINLSTDRELAYNLMLSVISLFKYCGDAPLQKESKEYVFTKKQVNEARRAKMLKEGQKFKKNDLLKF